MADVREFLSQMFFHALERVRAPERLIRSLPQPPQGRTVVLAAGKAAAQMAQIVEQHWDGELSGLAVTPPGYETPLKRIACMVAGHPVPDERSVAAGGRFLSLARDLGADDLALVLLSGGGSALLACPAPGLTLADKQTVTRALFAAGADIHEINTVRKHLSAIKGGRLARTASPAPVVSCAVSDVVGNDPGVIASGPTAGDATTVRDALCVLQRYDITCPERIVTWLDDPRAETPKPDDPDMMMVETAIIATGADALSAATEFAHARGYTVHNLGDRICGEAREVARDHARRACQLARRGGRHVILSGGEVTVTIGTAKAAGGGPNREYALALAVYLDGHPGIAALAADTDGMDGTGDAAGGFVLPDTLGRARAARLDPASLLAAHASGDFFDRLGDCFVTGPTLTNVNDFRAIVVEGAIDD